MRKHGGNAICIIKIWARNLPALDTTNSKIQKKLKSICRCNAFAKKKTDN